MDITFLPTIQRIRVPSRMRIYAYIDLQYKEFEFVGMTVGMNICENWD